MANVQPENGWFRLVNELSEALALAACTGSEHRVLHAVMRETYGRGGPGGRKMSRLTEARIGELTGLSRRRAGDVLRSLESRKMIIIQRAGHRRTSEIGIQKDHGLWLTSSALKRQSAPADKGSTDMQSAPADFTSAPADGGTTAPADGAPQRQKTPTKTSPRAKRKPKPNLNPPALESYAQALYLKTGVSALDGFRPLTTTVLKSCMTRRPGTRAETVVRWYAWKIPDLLDHGTKSENLGRTASNWFGMAVQGLSKVGIDDQLRSAMSWAAGFDRAQEAARVADECREFEAEQLRQVTLAASKPKVPFRLTRIPLKAKTP